MKKAMVFLAVAMCGVMGTVWGAYGGGDGSATTPYQIGTVGHWQTLTATPADWGKHFELTADIDFDGLSITPVGNDTTPFTGVFDGQGHVLLNAVIHLPGSNNVGVFGKVGSRDNSNAHIMNLGVENITVTGASNVGGLVGSLVDGVIDACYVSCTVTGEAGGYGTGGLVGSLGGLIINCYSMGNVTGDSAVGGFMGGVNNSSSPIVASYSTCSVNGTGWGIGGFMGSSTESIEHCFWDVETSGKIISGGGRGLPTATMQNTETYLNSYWDFVGEVKNGTADVWYMPAEGRYPVLAWQVADLFVLAHDEMAGAAAIAEGTPAAGTTVGATGLDITANGYQDCLDVWYAFDCAATGVYTVKLTGDFDTTLGVFDGQQREIAFNDDFFGGKSQVILKAVSGKRYYLRVAGVDAQTGAFALSVNSGAVAAIQGDLNYDGKVNLVDLSLLAQNWLLGM